MQRFTKAIRRDLKYRNWYGALALALALPDICGHIAYPNLRTRARYSRWFEEHLSPVYGSHWGGAFLTGNDCYALRCAYLHTGDDDITDQTARESLHKFFFTTMNAHLVAVDATHLTLNVRLFCLEICEAVDAWAVEAASDPRMATEMQGLLMIHTGLFSPGPGVELHVATSEECQPLDDD